MKFAALAITALSLASPFTVAFAPLKVSGSSGSSSLNMAGATETKTYTFTKSEEIFAEALTVRLLQ